MHENKTPDKIKYFFRKYISKPHYIIVSFLVLTFLVTFLLTYFELKKISNNLEEYKNNTLNLTRIVMALSDNFTQRTSKLSSAEILLNNTNQILSTIYYGTANKDELEDGRDFTAFAIKYKEEFYVITAGHCVEMDGEKYNNFKFKANNKTYFISLKLIDYKSDYKNNNDYAIFYDPLIIRTGLYPASPNEDQTPQYILGNMEKDLNLVKRYKDAKEGESGSPVINSKCHVVGIIIKKGGAYTPISEVLKALDKIELKK